MDLLSGHHYTERKLRVPFTPEDAASYERNFLVYSDDVAAGVRRLVADFRARLGQGNVALDRVRLAIDEWGIVRDWNAAPDGPGIGSFEHYYTLGDAIAAGRALHELLRSADVVAMANWAQTVNVIGTIKTSRNCACLDPAGHLLALYRAQMGGAYVPVTVAGSAPVDAVAAWDKSSKALSIGLINYSPNTDAEVVLDLPGQVRFASAKTWRIAGPSLGATNLPGQPETVTTAEVHDQFSLDRPFRLPQHSITVLRLERVDTNGWSATRQAPAGGASFATVSSSG
jgi:alpha-N-arabinofuranosidase